jgi:MoaA/NifB/PqqE/SkfB family radical SAM enzyme
MQIKEWDDKFNSFNSYKGLMYFEWYRAILEGNFLHPIEASVDPVNACNLKCVWCNGYDVQNRNVYMDNEHLLELVKFIKEWGVKAICFAGGGEPTLHPILYKAIDLCSEIKIPVAIISNGTFNSIKLAMSLASNCRWIGISVDAATPQTYEKLKKADLFNRVIENIMTLVKLGAREVTYKFLLHPDNQHEVYEAIELAKDLGCHRIHIRPVSFMNFQDHEDNYDIESINNQVMKGRAIFEDERFRVFYVQHKFNKDLHRMFNFKKCLATPIMPIFQANGDISICIDRKADKSLVIGSHLDISKIKDIWGSEKHKEVIKNINLNDCPKCTIQHCNEFIEKAIINNQMDWEFT